MVPVGSNLGKSGSFVMILSTNANAIADTIGGFAENKVVMNSMLYLATREDGEKAAAITATAGITRSSRNSTFTAISDVAAVDANTPASRQAKWLSVLRSAAAGISPDAPPNFATLEEAKAWFASVDRRGSQ